MPIDGAPPAKRKGAKPGSRTRAAVAPAAAALPSTPSLIEQARAMLGRPSVYSPEMCATVVAAGLEGCGKAEIAARLGVNRDTVLEWCGLHPEFSGAISLAAELAHAWWEKLARENMLTRDFNGPAYAFQMTNRFRGEWSTKVTVAGDPDSPPIIERVEYVIVDAAQDGRA